MRSTWIRAAGAIGVSAAFALGSAPAWAQATSGSSSSMPSTTTPSSQPTPKSTAPARPSAASHADASRDAGITKQVKTALASHGIEGKDMSVTTRRGDVRLKGKVASRSEKMKAEKAAGGVHGVRKVNASGLKVK